jgi:hypothetical protein
MVESDSLVTGALRACANERIVWSIVTTRTGPGWDVQRRGWALSFRGAAGVGLYDSPRMVVSFFAAPGDVFRYVPDDNTI